MQAQKENLRPAFISIKRHLEAINKNSSNNFYVEYFLDKILSILKNPVDSMITNAETDCRENPDHEIIDEQEILHGLIDILTPTKSILHSHIVEKNLNFFEGIFNSPFFIYFKEYRDEENRNLPMRILTSWRGFMDEKRLLITRKFCNKWLMYDDGFHRDIHSFTLGDYLVSASGSAFPEFQCTHPLSKKLESLHYDSRLPTAEAENLVFSTIKDRMSTVEIYLFVHLLRQIEKNPIEILDFSENHIHLFLKNFFQNPSSAAWLRSFLDRMVTYHEFSRLKILNDKIHNIKNLAIEDIHDIIGLKNLDIKNFELFFCYILLNIASNHALFEYTLRIVNLDSIFSRNLLRISLEVLKEKVSDSGFFPSALYKSLKSHTTTYCQPSLSRKNRNEIISSGVELFALMNKKSNGKLREQFDIKEKISNSVLPIQGYVSSRNRKKRHLKYYQSTSYNTELYDFNFNDELNHKIDLALEELNFISTCIHVTNWTTIHQVLDSGILSRNCLIKKRIQFFEAALNPVSEKIDADIVCLGFDDVDDLALQNCKEDHPPARITFNFKKIWQYRTWIPGQVCEKEHDFFWTFKPGAAKNNSSNTYENFVRKDIPDEFAKPIAIADIKLSFYRTAFGIKFVVNDQKHILLYSIYNKGIYAFQPELNPQIYNILEEVIDYDFGQTIYYGHPENTEKFFVTQFFRHIQKLPILCNIICDSLKKLSHNEMVNVFNQIGKKLMHGSELNFQRGFYPPVECIEKVEFMAKYDPSILKNSYGCNSIFNNKNLQPTSIDFSIIASQAEKNQINEIKLAHNKYRYLFKSYRFLAFLLDKTLSGTETHRFLESEFNEIYGIERSQMCLSKSMG